MKRKIQVGKTYKGKYSGILVVAKSLEDKEGWFFAEFKNNSNELRKMQCYIDAFELYEPEFKYPTLFEVVLKYQSLGINIDFDNRGGRNMCFVSKECSFSPTRRSYVNFSYNKTDSEKEIVKQLLHSIGLNNIEARNQLIEIMSYEK